MILLSFDTEEFDVPREHGVDFPLDEAMKVSVYGTSNSSVSKLNNIIAISRITTADVYKRQVQEGDITIDGTSIRDVRIADLRSLIGNVNQEAILSVSYTHLDVYKRQLLSIYPLLL